MTNEECFIELFFELDTNFNKYNESLHKRSHWCVVSMKTPLYVVQVQTQSNQVETIGVRF